MSRFSVSVDAIALAAATAKTIFELATPATTDVIPFAWWVEFDGVSSAAVPVKVEVGRFSAAVTTASAITPSKMGAATLASACTAKHTTSTEGAGTASDVETHRVSPTSGVYIQYPLGREWYLGASGFWRIRCTAAAVVNVTFGFQWEE